MADEIRINAGINYKNLAVKAAKIFTATLDITGESYIMGTQQIGTSEEVILQGGDLGTPGYIIIRNVDLTNYVELGITTGVYSIKLKAEEVALFRVNGATLYANADTAACFVEYFWLED